MSSSDLINWLLVIVSLNICSTLSQQIYNPTNELPVRYLPANDEDLSRFDPKLLDEGDRRQWRNLPQPQPIDVKQEIEKLIITHRVQSTWASAKQLGTVSQVSFDLNGDVVVFHRGDHVWNGDTFNIRNEYQPERVPIKQNTLIAFDRSTGNVVYEYGKDLFYMPHGLTIDHEGNVWITDEGLHQVMKFNANGDMKTPEITLGVAFKPGPAKTQFCKPTAVAVLPDGQFFVSDGYCNFD